jgi:hypothetical protein
MPGDTKIKSWYDGLFESGLAISATAGLIKAFPCSAEQAFGRGFLEKIYLGFFL